MFVSFLPNLIFDTFAIVFVNFDTFWDFGKILDTFDTIYDYFAPIWT